MIDLYITPKGDNSPIIKINRVVLNREQSGSLVTLVTEDARRIEALRKYIIHPINVEITVDRDHHGDNTIQFHQ